MKPNNKFRLHHVLDCASAGYPFPKIEETVTVFKEGETELLDELSKDPNNEMVKVELKAGRDDAETLLSLDEYLHTIFSMRRLISMMNEQFVKETGHAFGEPPKQKSNIIIPN